LVKLYLFLNHKLIVCLVLIVEASKLILDLFFLVTQIDSRLIELILIYLDVLKWN